MRGVWILLAAVALSLNAAEPEQERFEVGFDSAVVDERGRVTTCVLFNDSQVHGFLPPPEMRLMLDGTQKKITFTGSDLNTTITLQFLEERIVAQTASQRDRVRQQVQERYPQGRIVEEGECYTADGKGCSFDVDYEIDHIYRRARICFVPIRDRPETVMFVLATSPSTFAGCHLPFMSTVSSFGTRTQAISARPEK